MLAPAMPSAGKLERTFKFAKARAERYLHQLCRAQANSNLCSSLRGTRSCDSLGSYSFYHVKIIKKLPRPNTSGKRSDSSCRCKQPLFSGQTAPVSSSNSPCLTVRQGLFATQSAPVSQTSLTAIFPFPSHYFFEVSLLCDLPSLGFALQRTPPVGGGVVTSFLWPVLQTRKVPGADDSNRQDSCRDSPDDTPRLNRSSATEAFLRLKAADTSPALRQTLFR